MRDQVEPALARRDAVIGHPLEGDADVECHEDGAQALAGGLVLGDDRDAHLVHGYLEVVGLGFADLDHLVQDVLLALSEPLHALGEHVFHQGGKGDELLFQGDQLGLF